LLFENKPTIALTGATGFLGSHLMASLLSGGYRIIILGRSNKKESLNERISRLLRWFGIVELAGQLEFVEIDFLKPLLGIPEAEYIWLCEKTEQIIHCASDTSFTERKREIVFKSNVNSLEGILDFAVNAQVKFFHYISTAYVAGANITVCKERLSSSSDFINVYEESKALAENIIAEFCTKNNIPYTLIRPSIVYGDSHSGRSLRFNALYFPIQSVNYIREIYLNDIKNNDGKKSKQSGIFLDEEGYLFLPLRIFLPKEGALNIIPVDYFVNATIKIIARASPGGIYHLTNNSHTKLESIAEYNERFMKIRGVEIIYGKPVDNDLRNPVEELFDRFVEPYRPYLSDIRIFERENTDILTDNLQPPVFSFEIFEKCMEYAISVNWGQSIL
jgi:Putative dehydrogenase domain of multifunctional non-ribosomal peptide synthetases and related enzymes